MSRPRIAYISDRFLPNTAADTEQTLSTIDGFVTSGAEVTLVVPRHPGQTGPTAASLAAYYQVSSDFSVETFVAPGLPRGLVKASHAIRSVLAGARAEFDILYTRNLPVVTAAAAARVGPLVYETYRPWPDQNRAVGLLLRGLAHGRAIAGVVLHSALASASFERAGFDPATLLVAHNAWDPRRLEPVLTRAQARTQTGCPAEGIIVSYAGRIETDKGLRMVLELADALPAVRFILVGSESDGVIEREATLRPNVRVLPWLPFDSVVPYLYAADVLVIPPTLSPLLCAGTTVLPLKTFLYMATGRAIFGPDGPDVREVLRDGDNALLVRADNPAAALAGLQRLLDDPALRDRLATRAREDVLHWTWNHRAAQILEFMAPFWA